MQLPETFIREMQTLWQTYGRPEPLADFLTALEQTPARGLRANGLKLSPEQLLPLLETASGEPAAAWPRVAWSRDGFYYPASFSPGRSPLYHAGLYYVQEPSAMLPAEILAARPGERVLDLCAAPGGKTSRLAADLGDTGLLWANEISGERVKALLRNVELMGASRCVITQETPERLARRLPGFFDRILVDAPCSGSGMFRRDPAAIQSWQKYGSAHCTILQHGILAAADQMLRPDGILVYSTCSFSEAEDEAMIAAFLASHADYRLLPINRPPTVSEGLARTPDMNRTARIWPHLARGDGHFCALLQKKAETDPAAGDRTAGDRTVGLAGGATADPDLAAAIAAFRRWAEPVLSAAGQERLTRRMNASRWRLYQGHLQLVPIDLPDGTGLHLIKTGLYLGEVRTPHRETAVPAARPHNGRTAWPSDSHSSRQQSPRSARATRPSVDERIFDPAHAWLLTLTAADLRYTLCLEADSSLMQRYLRGETLDLPPGTVTDWPVGATAAVCLGNFPLGWARRTPQGQLKNLYPPGWRRLT